MADVTVAFVAPKYTMLLAAIGLKLLPDIVTDMPGRPEPGLNEVIMGDKLQLSKVIAVAPEVDEQPLLPVMATE